jgi:hypothetical protein
MELVEVEIVYQNMKNPTFSVRLSYGERIHECSVCQASGQTLFLRSLHKTHKMREAPALMFLSP